MLEIDGPSKPQHMMILCKLMHCCTLEYQTAYKVVKLAQPYTSTAVKCIIHMNEAVIIDTLQHFTAQRLLLFKLNVYFTNYNLVLNACSGVF